MAQFLRPISDISNSGSWTTAPLWSKINDGSDGTTIASPTGTNPEAGFTVGLGTGDTPDSGTRQIVVRVRKNASGGQNRSLTANLRDSSGTLIQSFNSGSLGETFTNQTFTVTSAISSYAGLRLELEDTRDGGGQARGLIISDAYFEIPDAAPPARPTVDLDTDNDFEYDTNKPTLEFTGTSENDDDIHYKLAILQEKGLIDSFNASTVSSSSALQIFNTLIGQSFMGNGDYIKSVEFRIHRADNPIGFLKALITEHSGTFGIDSVPASHSDDDAYAISELVNMESLSDSADNVKFIFKSPFKTINGVPYCIGIKYEDGRDLSDGDVRCHYGLNNLTHPGNFFSGNFSADSRDTFFFLYGYSGVLEKNSEIDDGFINTENGADSDPFNSGEKIAFTVQTGDELENGDYLWSVRGKNPDGEYGEFAELKSFSILAGSSVYNAALTLSTSITLNNNTTANILSALLNLDSNTQLNIAKTHFLSGAIVLSTINDILLNGGLNFENSITLSTDSEITLLEAIIYNKQISLSVNSQTVTSVVNELNKQIDNLTINSSLETSSSLTLEEEITLTVLNELLAAFEATSTYNENITLNTTNLISTVNNIIMSKNVSLETIKSLLATTNLEIFTQTTFTTQANLITNVSKIINESLSLVTDSIVSQNKLGDYNSNIELESFLFNNFSIDELSDVLLHLITYVNLENINNLESLANTELNTINSDLYQHVLEFAKNTNLEFAVNNLFEYLLEFVKTLELNLTAEQIYNVVFEVSENIHLVLESSLNTLASIEEGEINESISLEVVCNIMFSRDGLKILKLINVSIIKGINKIVG